VRVGISASYIGRISRLVWRRLLGRPRIKSQFWNQNCVYILHFYTWKTAYDCSLLTVNTKSPNVLFLCRRRSLCAYTITDLTLLRIYTGLLNVRRFSQYLINAADCRTNASCQFISRKHCVDLVLQCRPIAIRLGRCAAAYQALIEYVLDSFTLTCNLIVHYRQSTTSGCC